MSAIFKVQTPADNTALFDTLVDRFNQLDTLDGVEFTDDVWKINDAGGRQVITLDFSLFDKAHVRFVEHLAVDYNEQEVRLSLPDIAKAIWLMAVEGKAAHPSLYNGAHHFIALLFSFLKEIEAEALTQVDLVDFYVFCLTQNVAQEGVVKRLSPPAYQARFTPLPLHHLLKIAQRVGVATFVNTVPAKKSQAALNEACVSVMGKTMADYREGGSFNFLGLDIGKHYVDHCQNLFDNHSLFITAVRQTGKWWLSEAARNAALEIKDQPVLGALGAVLSGAAIEDIPHVNLKLGRDKRTLSECLIQQQFRKCYKQAQQRINPFKIDTVERIVSACKLPERYDSQEFIRALLFVDVFGAHGKSKDAIYQEYKATLEKSDTPFSVSLADIEAHSREVIDSLNVTPPPDKNGMRRFFKEQAQALPVSLQDHHSNGMTYFAAMSAMIEDAGVTCFLGLTGWRASEYGFALSNIGVELNHDPLDNQYTPWRFHARWKVPKTSGETPLDREITLSSYILAAQLAEMNCADDDKPALYKVSTENQRVDSAFSIQYSVTSCWSDFVTNYCLFTDVDQWQELGLSGQLSKDESKELDTLNSTYRFESSQMTELIRIKDKLRSELPRVELTLKRGGSYTFGHKLREYIAGKAKPDVTALFDEFLSDETKKILVSGEIELDKAGVRFVRGEFLGDAPYPSPHAFRHMWAEAVLRRYRGDVGRFIRANFKHLDDRFFMAYLRGKTMKAIVNVVKRQAANDIVQVQLDSLGDDNRGYAGGFDRFLSKAVGITKVQSHEDYKALAENVSQRVVDIKSNPWADCLLREGTNKTAKCSIDGIPQRQNASPKLCLGCINGNIAEGNFNGILVYTQQDVKACRNPKLPWFIKEPHVHTVNSALKRVKELRENSGKSKYDPFIKLLEETLKMAEQHREDAA
jgi:hypothetical protein